MLNPSAFSTAALVPGGAHLSAPPATAAQPRSAAACGAQLQESPGDDEAPIEWTEEDVVLLHWRLLVEVRRRSDPETPLDEKYDTLRWILTEREKDAKPFSFVNCLRVVAAVRCHRSPTAAGSTPRSCGITSATASRHGWARR